MQTCVQPVLLQYGEVEEVVEEEAAAAVGTSEAGVALTCAETVP